MTRNGADAPLEITLFGLMQVRVRGRPVETGKKGSEEKGSREKALRTTDFWLLALLALEERDRPGPIERSFLAQQLWPDNVNGDAYINHGLSALRRALAPENGRLTNVGKGRVRLDLAGAALDFARFQDLLETNSSTALEEAIDLYRGPLLEGCEDTWVMRFRHPLHKACLAAMQQLAADAAAKDEGKTQQWLRRAYTLSHLNAGTRREDTEEQEAVLRQLMEALARTDNCSEMAAFYEDFRSRSTPAAETTALYRCLYRQGRLRARLSARPLAALEPSRLLHGFPTYADEFVGRENELAVLQSLVRTRPLVTLVGFGGNGKTRLAVEAAERLTTEDAWFQGDAWFVALGALRDGALLPQTVASGLRLPVTSEAVTTDRLRDEIIAAIIDAMGEQRRLLVLDTAEHLLDGCGALVDALTRACRGLRVIVTSRQALGIAGEAEVPVLPLPFSGGLSPAELEQSDASRLFMARAAETGAALTPGDTPAVADLCRRLDGVPFLLELAAAQCRSLPVAQIAAGTRQILTALRGRHPSALRHQQTVTGMMEWSFGLLPSDALRRFAFCLSVFSGGWDEESAALFADGDFWQAHTRLAELRAHSLTFTRPAQDSSGSVGDGAEPAKPRWHMLELVRQYGQEKLGEMGLRDQVRDQHRDGFLALAETAKTHFQTPDRKIWMDRLEAEQDNLRAALDWCLASESGTEVGLKLTAALWEFWSSRGHLAEGRTRLAAALAREDAELYPMDCAKARNGAGVLAHRQGDFREACFHHHRSLRLRRRLEDRKSLIVALSNLGVSMQRRGKYRTTEVLLSCAMSIDRERGNDRGIADTLHNLGYLAYARGDLARARRLYEECLTLRRLLGQEANLGGVLVNLGLVTLDEGDLEAAQTLFQESRDRFERAKDLQNMAAALHGLGMVARRQEKYAAAAALYRQSLAIEQDLGNKTGIAESLNAIATLLWYQASPQEAATVFGAEAALREAIGAPIESRIRSEYQETLIALQTLLGSVRFQQAWEKGSSMTTEAAIRYTLNE